MELLAEVRILAQVLNFALSPERGQEKQTEILRSSALNCNNQLGAVSNNAVQNSPNQQHCSPKTDTNKELLEMRRTIFPRHINQRSKPIATYAKRWKTSQYCVGRKHHLLPQEETKQ